MKALLEECISRGLTQREIGIELSISQSTVGISLKKYSLVTRVSTKDKYDTPEAAREARRLYEIKYTTDRKIKMKQKAVDYKGGQCEKCGYSKTNSALQFHHKDPSKKTMSLTSRELAGTKWETCIKELDLCTLLCANCHAEIHEEMRNS